MITRTSRDIERLHAVNHCKPEVERLAADGKVKFTAVLALSLDQEAVISDSADELRALPKESYIKLYELSPEKYYVGITIHQVIFNFIEEMQKQKGISFSTQHIIQNACALDGGFYNGKRLLFNDKMELVVNKAALTRNLTTSFKKYRGFMSFCEDVLNNQLFVSKNDLHFVSTDAARRAEANKRLQVRDLAIFNRNTIVNEARKKIEIQNSRNAKIAYGETFVFTPAEEAACYEVITELLTYSSNQLNALYKSFTLAEKKNMLATHASFSDAMIEKCLILKGSNVSSIRKRVKVCNIEGGEFLHSEMYFFDEDGALYINRHRSLHHIRENVIEIMQEHYDEFCREKRLRQPSVAPARKIRRIDEESYLVIDEDLAEPVLQEAPKIPSIVFDIANNRFQENGGAWISMSLFCRAPALTVLPVDGNDGRMRFDL